jgi:hypothetical protein
MLQELVLLLTAAGIDFRFNGEHQIGGKNWGLHDGMVDRLSLVEDYPGRGFDITRHASAEAAFLKILETTDAR